MADAEQDLAIVRLGDSTRRLVRTVDGLDEAGLAAMSLLPGWTRAHVVAHLALNAEAMTRGLDGVRSGRPVPLYDSRQAREDDIEVLAHAARSEVRERFLGSTTRFADLLAEVAGPHADQEVEWFPGGIRRPVAAFAGLRRAEVEVHHADLGIPEHDSSAWPGDFSAWVLDARSASAEAEPAFTAYAGDLDQRWSFGGGGADPDGDAVVVTGPAHALAWWAAGRGTGAGLACDGPLPRIGAW